DTSSTLLNVSTCKAYTLNDSVYTQAGSYVQRFENVIGCDSFVRLNLSFYEHTPTILPIGSTLYVREKFAAYQWMKNGADIDGATDSFYVVTENANYRVRVTEAGSDCEFTSAVYIVDNVSVSDATTFADQIKVYPNPVSGTLHIKSPVTVNAHISSMDGRLIKFVERADAVDLSQLSSGIYILRLMDLGQHVIKTEKLVVD